MAPNQSIPMNKTTNGKKAAKSVLNSEVDGQIEKVLTKKSARRNIKLKFRGEKKGVEVVKKPEPIFKIFSANTQLQGGLCVLRHLEGGNYEIANLETLSRTKISSEGAGIELKSSPDRVALLTLTDRRWAYIASKVKLAARIAAKDIFPFQKLPIELRFKIYELIVPVPYKIRFELHLCGRLKTDGLQLMLTCRQFYEECQTFFWRNNFEATSKMLSHLRKTSYFGKNVREITYHWRNLVLDGDAFSKMAKFPRLQILNIEFTSRLLNMELLLRSYHSYNRNCLHQSEPSIKRFSIANGFDNLVQIRGLESVTFKNIYPGTAKEDADIAAFQKFLNETLTLPHEGGVKNKDYKTPVPKKRASGAKKSANAF